MENGERVTRRFVAEGPIACISTTTKDRLTIDDESRHFSIWVDESQPQTKRIAIAYAVDRQPLSKDEFKVWHRVQELLQDRAAMPIVLPSWFPTVAAKVYCGDLRIRRYFPQAISAVKTLALLRSFQKLRDQQVKRLGKIEVDFVDFAMMVILFEPVFSQTLHRGSTDASFTRAIVEQITKGKGGQPVEARELANELSISKDKAYALLRDATMEGVIVRVNKPERGNRKLYLPSVVPRFLPHPGKIFREIPEVGDVADFIHPLNGEHIVLRRR
jgi:hypothetical protein